MSVPAIKTKPNKKEAELVDDSFKKVELTVTDPRTLILALSSVETEVNIKALDFLDKHASISEKNRVELKDLNVLEPLCNLLLNSSEVVRNTATCLTATLVKSFDVRRAVRAKQLPFLDSLVKLIVPTESAITRENSCLALWSFCEEFANRSDLFKLGAIENIIGIMSSSEPEVQRAMLKLSYSLCDEYNSRDQFIQLGGTESLIEFLSSEYPEIQQLSLETIALCSKNQSNRAIITESGGLQRLIDFVCTPDSSSSHVHALKAIATMLADPSCLSSLCESAPATKEGVPPPPIIKLLSFLTPAQGTPIDVQINVANCIYRAALNQENSRLLYDVKAEEYLVKRLFPDDPKIPVKSNVVTAVCNALSALASSKSSSELIGKYQAIPVLVKLLNIDDSACVNAVIVTLTALATEVADNKRTMCDLDVVAKLLTVFEKGNADHRSNTLRLFAVLAKFQYARHIFSNSGPVELIINCISDNDKLIKINAINCITSLAVDEHFRQELMRQEGAEAICNVIKISEDSDVRNACACTIDILASDHVVASKFTSIGLLEILQDKIQKSKQANAYLENAVNKILKKDLSAKYSLRWHLDVDDIINDIFFDVGRIRKNEPIPLLTALSQLPVDDRPPVILVNCVAMKQPEEDEKRVKRITKNPKKSDLSASSWRPAQDPALLQLIAEVKSIAASCELDKQKLAQSIAVIVANRMGGSLNDLTTSQFGFALDFAELKLQTNSNVVLIGNVIRGGFDTRALLFKVLCDQVDVNCELIRNDYARSYNILHLQGSMYIIDLVNKIGTIYPISNRQISPFTTNLFFPISF